MTTQTCEHGRPVTTYGWWRGNVACDDCDEIEWQRVKLVNVIGLSLLVMLVFVPLILLLSGAFW